MTGRELKARLKTRGLSQLELARRLGVSGRRVRQWIAADEVPASREREVRLALRRRRPLTRADRHEIADLLEDALKADPITEASMNRIVDLQARLRAS